MVAEFAPRLIKAEIEKYVFLSFYLVVDLIKAFIIYFQNSGNSEHKTMKYLEFLNYD